MTRATHINRGRPDTPRAGGKTHDIRLHSCSTADPRAGVGFALLLTAAAKYLGPSRPDPRQGHPVRVRLRADRHAARALLGEVLPGRDPVPGLRHRGRVHVPVGDPLPGSCPARAPLENGVCTAGVSVLRLRRDAGVRARSSSSRSPTSGERRRSDGSRAHMGLDVYTGKLADAVNWARKFSLFPYPFVTACCGMEFMSVAAPKYDIARFGAEFPRFSPRQADLLMVVGTITEKQGPALSASTTRWPSPSGSSRSACARRPAASTRTTRRCRAPIRSSPSTSTSPAARRVPSRCSTALIMLHGPHPARRGPQPAPRAEARASSIAEPRRRSSELQGLSRRRSAMSQKVLDALKAQFTATRSLDDAARSTATRSRGSSATPAVARGCARSCDGVRRAASTGRCSIDLTARRRASDASEPRFEVVYQLRSLEQQAPRAPRGRACPRSDPRVDVARRAVAGVQLARARDVRHVRHQFDGHPDLRRIFMYEEFVGYPLRKDYPKEKRQPLVRRDDLPINPIKADGAHANGATAHAQAARPRLARTSQDLSTTRPSCRTELMTVNMGPSHPAMHGTVRIVLTVDGETVVKGDVQPGYLHRCFEKESGARDVHAGVPVHRPPQLRLADDQQRRLGDGGREAARHHRAASPSARSTSA